jgi:hypothetical protein
MVLTTDEGLETMNDLLQATGYAALVYLLFNYLVTFGSGRPLVEWINPGRRYLPLLAFTLIFGAYGSLRVASARHQETQLELLRDLIGKERAKPEVVGATSFIVFGVALLLLYFWCWWTLPRAPQTFNANPKDLVREYRRALRHYVRWAGGLDYAILAEVRSGTLVVVAEGADDAHISRGLNRLPGVHAGATPGAAASADLMRQKQIWKDLALDLFRRWPDLDQILNPARQGRTIGVSFDVRYGAIYAEMLEDEPAAAGEIPTGIFLFAASMNQHEVGTLTAAKHFAMLNASVRHIRSGVAKG